MTQGLGHTVDAAAAVLPQHIAIIMDGNGRWAKSRYLPRALGHREGAEAVRRTVTACGELGVPYLTLFAFSSENWKRPADEVDDLMWLLRSYLQREVNELNRQRVRIGFIGERSALAPDLVSLIENAEMQTRQNDRLIFTIAVNYGGQHDIVAAAQRLAREVAAGHMQPDQITPESFAAHLMTTGLPDPDLIIRTSGEQRLSNFMLWQAAYSELIFLDTLWPDFSRQSLEQAIELFNRRERRFGATGES
ncbi:MAG: isoprenyl transferase [Alphaproteobacteria bacterium]|nr:isoprenyl transferase [Alphaproteobacteria bacterium]